MVVATSAPHSKASQRKSVPTSGGVDSPDSVHAAAIRWTETIQIATPRSPSSSGIRSAGEESRTETEDFGIGRVQSDIVTWNY